VSVRFPAAVALVLPAAAAEGPGLDGGGESDGGGGQGKQVSDGGDVGPSLHLLGSDHLWVVRGGRSVLTPPSLWSPVGVELFAAVLSLLVTAGAVGLLHSHRARRAHLALNYRTFQMVIMKGLGRSG